MRVKTINNKTKHNSKMKKTIISRHNANLQVVNVLKTNESKYSGIPAMVNAVADLNSSVDKAVELFAKVGSIPNKPAGNKNVAKSELTAICLVVSNVVHVYAFMKKDENLLNFLVTSEAELGVRMRQQDLLNYAKNLAEKIAPIATELADYGLTEELKAELNKEIAEFEKLMIEPRQLINERKNTNEMIEDCIVEIYSLLINRIDPFMELFNGDEEFYRAYKNARMIVNPANRKRTEEEVAVDEQ